MTPPIRSAFKVYLKAGALEEWAAAHEAVWPDLLEEQGRCGFRWMAVYAEGEALTVVSEVDRPDAWERLIATDVHKRWVASLAHLSASALPDDTVAREPLREVLALDWTGGS